MFCIACFLIVCCCCLLCFDFFFPIKLSSSQPTRFLFFPPILFPIPLGVGVSKWLRDAELSAKLNHSNQSVKAKRPWLGPLHF